VNDARYLIVLDGVLPMSMNERERCHYWKRKKELDEITRLVGLAAVFQNVPTAEGRRGVRVTIHKSKRSRVTDDPANRDSRAKSVLDALVANGLLVDDNDAGLDWHHVDEGERSSNKATVIELWDCEDAS
jgi:hypothetical protein